MAEHLNDEKLIQCAESRLGYIKDEIEPEIKRHLEQCDECKRKLDFYVEIEKASGHNQELVALFREADVAGISDAEIEDIRAEEQKSVWSRILQWIFTPAALPRWRYLAYGFSLVVFAVSLSIISMQIAERENNRLRGAPSMRGGLEEAFLSQQEALRLYINIGHKSGQARSLMNIALIYREQGNLQKALEYSQKAAGIYREIGDKEGEAAALRNTGDIYRDYGDLEEASFYQKEAIRLYEEMLSDMKEENP